MPDDTTVRFPKELREEYNNLPRRWLNFADFVREAVRYYLDRERNRASMISHEGISESEKDQEESLSD